MTTKKVYQAIASAVQARTSCAARNDHGRWHEWVVKHQDHADQIVRDHLPSGSGFDSATKIDWDKTTADRLVFIAPFHHMDDSGYVGWTDHNVTVRASLVHGFELRISGRNRNEIKDYIADTFHAALSADVAE